MDIKKQFSIWWKSQVTRCNLIEGKTYLTVSRQEYIQTRTDYFLTAEAAQTTMLMANVLKRYEVVAMFESLQGGALQAD